MVLLVLGEAVQMDELDVWIAELPGSTESNFPGE
jgi:hypothetical protein